MQDKLKQLFKLYKVREKKLSDKVLFKILELISREYDIHIINCEMDNCNYSILIQIGEDDNNSDDETPPNNQGYGWTLKEAIISLLLCKRIHYMYDDIRYELMDTIEKHTLTLDIPI